MTNETTDWRARGDLCARCKGMGCPQEPTWPPDRRDDCNSFEEMGDQDWKIHFDILHEKEKLRSTVPESVRHLGSVYVLRGVGMFSPRSLYLPKFEIPFLQAVGPSLPVFFEGAERISTRLKWCGNLSRCVVKSLIPGDARRGAAWVGERVGYVNRGVIGLRTEGVNVYGLVKTFAHEAVHQCQYYSNRLQFTEAGALWCGRACTLPYAKQPWEIEARREAERLVRLTLPG
jgi:hypothetical protein